VSYRYEVALSFAGEDRAFAEKVAEGLSKAEVNVFYDNFYADDLWGEDLAVKLREVYHKASQFCIMIISQNYIDRMWPNHERQQAIERMIQEKGKIYVLPVRLDGFDGEVPGLSGTIGYLTVKSSEPQKLVDAFLRKVGREGKKLAETEDPIEKPKSYIPRIKKRHTDREKHQFLRSSFNEVVNLIEQFAADTNEEYSEIEYDVEKVTSRKVIFSLYKNGELVTRAKVFIGGMFGSDAVSVVYGTNIDISNDNTYNDIFSLKEDDGELGFNFSGMTIFSAEQEKVLNPREVADYIWRNICQDIT